LRGGEIANRIQTHLQVGVGGMTADRRFSFDTARCLGACGLAPVMVVDSDTHGGVSTDAVTNILEEYI
ncbi:MAG: NAD(P)H-dependent oxidoreductase subunit E, partial [Deltaproteobacteria bacterium]|nr:NAD(P)H-dependent oxidoreductase subunit E [Deltaproteobacteria bacterium]